MNKIKKITLLFALLITSIGYAQTGAGATLQNFQTGDGTAGLGETFGGGLAEIVDDPAPVSGTVRGKVAKLTAVVAGAGIAIWQGTNINLDANVRLTDPKTMQLDVYSTTAGISIVVIAKGRLAGAPLESKAVLTHGGAGWETLTATFGTVVDGKPVANGVYSEFAIHYLWNTTTNTFITPAVARVFYVDNIGGFGVARPETCSDGIMNQDETGTDCGGTCDACPAPPAPPTTAPPTPPTRAVTDVMSLYSEAYTNLASNFDAGWCGASSVEEVTIADNKVQAYKGNTCQGIVLETGVDASTFTNLHMDIYIDESVTDFVGKAWNLKFVQKPDDVPAKEVIFNATTSTPVLVAGEWISIDVAVDLTAFTGFKEFGVTGTALQNKVWYDNLYIYKGEATTVSVSDNESLNVSMYPNPVADRLNISAANRIKNVSVFNVLGRKVLSLNSNKNSESIDVSNLSSGIYLIKYQLENATGTAKFIKE